MAVSSQPVDCQQTAARRNEQPATLGGQPGCLYYCMKTDTPYYIGIDIGTTPLALLLTLPGKVLALERALYPTLSPLACFQEQEPSTLKAAEVLKTCPQLESPRQPSA